MSAGKTQSSVLEALYHGAVLHVPAHSRAPATEYLPVSRAQSGMHLASTDM